MQSLNVTTYSISIVVSARHGLGKNVVTNVKINPDITPPDDEDSIRYFFRAYGDSQVSSISLGGEYYAVYVLYSQTSSEQTQLISDLQAKGLYSGVSVDGDLQAKVSSFMSTTSTRTQLRQTVSGIENPKLPLDGNIIGYATAFPGLELDAPKIIKYETTGYEHVPKFRTQIDWLLKIYDKYSFSDDAARQISTHLRIHRAC
jgi:hypothetical protein